MPTDDMSFSPESAAALPQELAEQIIDYLHHDNDKQSMLACSLLSYPFLFAARHRLFDKVAIDWGYAKSAKNGIRDVQSFLEVLNNPRSSLVHYIRRLSIQPQAGSGWLHVSTADVLFALTKLPNLRSLRVRYLYFTDDTKSFSVPFSPKNHLEYFAARWVDFATQENLYRFLGGIGYIHILVFESCFYDEIESEETDGPYYTSYSLIEADSRRNTVLEETFDSDLRITLSRQADCTLISSILFYIQHQNIQIRFLTLKLQNTVPQSAICRLLLACQISLKCLTIIVDDEWNKILETETLPLKNCVNLDTFVISSRTFLHHRRIDAWANFLTRVSACPKVRKIQIQWRFSPNIVWSDIPTILSYFPLAEWAWLDDSMKSYQNLQEVVLDISGLNADAIDSLQNHFSHFSSLSIVTLGLLKVKSGLNLDGDMEDFEHHPS